MCGLAGVASTARRKDEMARKEAFRQLMEAASWRGKDASGVACVPITFVKQPATVYKKAVKAADFLELEQYRRLERNFDEYGYVLGHARSATSDGWNMADRNAHPFQYGPITMVHNGTIRNCRNIDSNIEHVVDSAHVAAAMAEQEPVKLLERLQGPFALVWHDARDGSLNFAKNNEKPLYWCYIEGENTMFWGSELEAIYAVLYRNSFSIEGKFRHCSSFAHFKFPDVHDLRKYVRTPFGKPPSSTGTHSRPLGEAWTEETRRLAGPHSPTGCTTDRRASESTQTQEKSMKETSTDTTSGSQTDTGETGTGNYVPGKDSLRPRSRRKIRSTQEKLLKLGRKLDNPICFTPEHWYSYKNQQGIRGMISGHDVVRQQKFQIGNVTKSVWGQALKAGKIYGRIVNAKADSSAKSGYCIVCDYAPDLMDRFIFKPVRPSPEVLDSGKPFPESPSAVDDAVQQTILATPKYLGPGDRKYTEPEYKELVKHGCSYCSADIQPEDHEDILWVGPHEQSPICEICSGNLEVKLSLGVVEERD